MESIILALSPFITSALTGWIKGWEPFESAPPEIRNGIVRAIAGFVAIVYAMTSYWLTGQFDDGAVAAAVDSIIVGVVGWLGSMGFFHAFFAKRD